MSNTNTSGTFRRFVTVAAVTATAILVAGESQSGAPCGQSGVQRVRSAYNLDETVARLKQDITAKGLKFFLEVDQDKLAAEAGINLRPSILLTFGNPGLGSQFITSDPAAGLDWPVRLLVYEDENSEVWAAYTDFAWIARRHGIKDRPDQFAKASEVIASITSSVAGPTH